MKEYDVIVVGSGGGSKLTRPAADLGLKVAICERSALGGTCLNRGCIPSKMLIHAADVATHARQAHRFNLTMPGEISANFTDLITRVSEVIDHESASIAPLYEKHPNIDYFNGHARFTKHNVLEINGEQITAPKIFLAVGCRPNIPMLAGLESTPYLTYSEALRLKEQPKRMIVIGGGYIGCELGYFYGALGTHVEFLVRSELLRQVDKETGREFSRAFKEQFTVHEGAKIKQISHDGAQFSVKLEHLTLEADALLVATGVRPNTDDLGLENTDVELDDQGYIQVDDRLETKDPGIFAFGDCIGRYLFRHTANFEGEYLFETQVKADGKGPIDYPPIPAAVFSHPQVGSVGATEEELIEKGTPYLKGVNPYAQSAMGMALRSEHGFCKLLFHEQTHKLLGAHIVGDEASNMVHMLIAYMKMGATLQDLLSTIYIHPALPEIVRNAARKVKV